MRDLETAQKILIVYGTLSIAYGFGLGIAVSRIRQHAPHAPRALMTAHLSAIIQGAVHLGLSVALATSQLEAWIETTGAFLLAAGSALFVAGATTNWLQKVVGDHFAERTTGWKLFAVSSVGHLTGIVIITVGVLTGVSS